MSMDRFNSAASTSGYIKFDELVPGTYPVNRFSIMKKSSFGGSRLLVHLEDGYVIMPARISDEFATPSEVRKLNEGKFNFIYAGKDPARMNRLDLKLEPFKCVPKCANVPVGSEMDNSAQSEIGTNAQPSSEKINDKTGEELNEQSSEVIVKPTVDSTKRSAASLDNDDSDESSSKYAKIDA